MFHFPAYPPRKTRCQPMTAGGLPHSDTLGSKPCRRLPQDYRGPTRPSSVLSAKASTIRPSRQPQQIIMTKALLKNPRTTSDHEAHHTACFQTIRTNPRTKTIPRIRITVRTPTPPTTGRADARVHYPVLKPPPHQDTHPAPTGTGQPAWGTHRQPHPPHGGRWRPGNPTARTTPQTNHDSSTPARDRQRCKPPHQRTCPEHHGPPAVLIISVERR